MNKNNLIGARLALCSEYVRRGGIVADIGTDHAYLPIWLAGNDIASHVYASDINEEPVKLAKSNIAKSGLNDKITTYIGDGLAMIPQDKVNDIIIAGMGGENIIGIISQAKWLQKSEYRLILQPMSRADKLRRYLYESGFDIIEEKSVCEANRVYTVICAEYAEKKIEYDEIKVHLGALSRDDAYIKAIAEKQAKILESEAGGLDKKGDSAGANQLRQTAEELIKYINQTSEE